MENDEIAIIGLSCRFPKSPTVDSFWENLKQGNELISFFSEEELLKAGIAEAVLKRPGYVKAKGALDQIDCFDASFFGYSAREAACMDPQQRIMLECAWEAFENAGYNPETCERLVGVFASSSFSSYFCFNLYPHLMMNTSLHQDEMLMVMGTEKDFLPTRISYKLNLQGPSKCIQTACSSSLVAVHDACQSLLNHECDMALAGGVSITCPQKNGYLYSKEGINSPDGHCRAFDRQAEGTLIGNGAGVVLLKRLPEAIKDRDTIRSIIKGSAVNNDGARKVGYTAPSIEGQSEVILSAQLASNVHPETISYIEAHGTGTLLGDPIEIKALTKAFRSQTKAKQYCRIGSVKTNMGHLDAAAGIAGLIKTVLALENQEIPPSLHYVEANSAISFDESPFFVNTQLTPWKRLHNPLRAGVSSFGIGGTNAHLILEEPQASKRTPSTHTCFLFTFSGKTMSALRTLLNRFIESLPRIDFDLADIAYTLQLSRSSFSERIGFIASSKEELLDIITKYVKNPMNYVHHLPISVESEKKRNIWFQIGQRWLEKESINWEQFYQDEKRTRVPLPTYPFTRESHWILPPQISSEMDRTNRSVNEPEISASQDIQATLLSIWKNSLKRNAIELHDDFFALGGDSLVALEILERIREVFKVDITLREFFENRTIKQLTAFGEQKLIEKISELSEEEALALLKAMDEP